MPWRSTRLKHLAASPIKNGLGEAGLYDDLSWPRYIRTTDIAGPRSLRPDTFASLRPEVACRAPLEPGDIVMTAAGATIGKSLLYTATERACYAGYLVRFRARADVEPQFIAYWMESAPYWAQIEAGKVVSTIENFSATKFQNLAVMVPDVRRQRAIVDFLGGETARIDALIGRKHRMMGLLEERKAATTLAAVCGRLTHRGPYEPSTLAWLDERPSHWREVLLRLVATTGSGHTPSRERPEWWEDCTIPWVTTGEVAQVRSDEREEIVDTREKISKVGLANSAAAIHPRGTVVLCRTASAGYSAIMGTEMATSQDFATWTCGSEVRPRYLLLCLRAMRPDLLGRLATGSTHKTIYMPDLHALRIPLPSLEEQDGAVEAAWQRLVPLFATMKRLQQQISLLKEHRQALITAAVTGELDVPGVAV